MQLHSTIFVELFRLASDMKYYRSDLGHDTLTLSRAKPGDRFVWAWRESGTQISFLPEHCYGTPDKDAYAFWADVGCREFYLIAVTRNEDGHAQGSITRLDWSFERQEKRVLSDAAS